MPSRKSSSPAQALARASRRAAVHARKVRRLQDELAPKLPQIEPHDLNLILDCMLRRPEERRYFIRKQKGKYVF